MKFNLLVILTLVFFLTGCGTGIISGRVVDENNEPVIGAQISTEPPTASKLSSMDGFTLKNIPVGIYNIVVSKTGYTKNAVEVKVQRNAKTAAEIQLKKLDK